MPPPFTCMPGQNVWGAKLAEIDLHSVNSLGVVSNKSSLRDFYRTGR